MMEEVTHSQLLKEKEAMEIINQILIPALDVVGDKFEKVQYSFHS